MIELNPTAVAMDFYRDCRARGLAPLTAQQYKTVAYEFLTETNPNLSMTAEYLDIKPSLIEYVNYCRKNDLSYSATKTKFTALNNYFTFLMDEGEININPILQFRARYVRTYKAPDTKGILSN